MIFLFLFPFFSSNLYSENFFPRSETPDAKYSVGEKFVYRINYLGIPVGEAVSEIVEKTAYKGRPAYHIAVKVKSYRMIDFIYKVRDEHHSYVDAETLSSLGYSAKIHEGFNKSEENSAAPEGMQDQLSCGYFFRTLKVKENSSVFIPVYAEGKKWSVEVKTFGVKPDKIEKIGSFEAALDTEPIMPFRGIFFRKGKITGLISLDKKRIPLRMTVKIPVLGSISSELAEYEPGKE